MLYSPDPKNFVVENHDGIKSLVSHLSTKLNANPVDDLVQDGFYKILSTDILTKKYNPNYKGFNNKPTQISTFLYRMFFNDIISYKRKESKMKKVDFYSSETNKDVSEDSENSIIWNDMQEEYKEMSNYNDRSDGLQEEFNDFDRFIQKKYNKIWTLKKSKGAKDEPGTHPKEFSVRRMWSHLREGYSNKEIADLYGISAKFVNDVSYVIKRAYEEFETDSKKI